MTTTTPSPGFKQVRYEINADSTSTLGQVTLATLTSSARYPIFELGCTVSDSNPETPKGGLAQEPPTINLAGQLPTESTVAPTVNPTPFGRTQVQPANAEATTQPAPTMIDALLALPTPSSTGMLGTTSTLINPELA
ncbi:hypothetical protein ACOSP7_031161 [Xanthoceras sorbifolium]